MKNEIAEFRAKKFLTQAELADTVGVARQTIIALEAGRYNPSLRLAYAITKALGAKKIEDVFHFE